MISSNMHNETRHDLSEFPTPTKIVRPLQASLLNLAWGAELQLQNEREQSHLAREEEEEEEAQPSLYSPSSSLPVLAATLWIKKFLPSEDCVSLLHCDSSRTDVQNKFNVISVDLDNNVSASEALSSIQNCLAATSHLASSSKAPTESPPCLILRSQHGTPVQLPERIRTSLVLAYSVSSSPTSEGSVNITLHTNPLAISHAQTQIFGRAYAEIYATLAKSYRAADLGFNLIDLCKPQPSDLEAIRHWNSASPIVKRWTTVHDLTKMLARENPDHPAVMAWDLSLTRGELDSAAEGMADLIHRTLRAVRESRVIGILIDKSGWVPVVILAVLKAGHSFVLLDQTLPVSRLGKMAGQLSCLAIVASKENVGLAARLGVEHVLRCDDSGVVCSLLGRHSNTTDEFSPQCYGRLQTSPASVLCHMFTSGSTGEPKAIEHSHFGFASSIPLPTPSTTPHDGSIQTATRMLASSSYNFAPAVVELLGTLVGGGTVCIPSSWEKTNDLAGAIKRLRADFAIMSPSLASALDFESLVNEGPLRTLWLAGEACPSYLAGRLSAIPALSAYPVYGSTETLCAVTRHRLNAAAVHSGGNGAIGKAYAMRIWLVHPQDPGELVGVGAVGELVIEGHSVANRYVGNAEQSRDTFIETPSWASRFKCTDDDDTDGPPQPTRWLRTGDLGVYDDDGNVQLLGRGNRHIKLHGQRIEPAEVEAAIKNGFADEVELVAVEVTYRDGNTARPRLTAFIVPSIACGGRLTPELWMNRIKDVLTATLPSFMVPTHTIILDRLPRTASGKIDRRALVTMGGTDSKHSLPAGQNHQDSAAADEEGASTSPKDQLRTLWSKVLQIHPSQIKDTTSWSELGGDSLQSIKLATAARQQGISLTVGQIMLQPRLEDQAQLMRPAHIPRGVEDHVTTEDSDATSDMTGFQRFAIQRARTPRHTLVYYVPVHIRGNFDSMRLIYALRTLVDRHDALRLQFSEEEDKLCIPRPGGRNVTSRVQVLECEDAAREVRLLMKQGLSGRRSSQLDQPVVFLLLLSPQSTRLLVKLHHACIDGSSMALLWTRLQMLYENPSAASTLRFPQFMPYLQRRLLQFGDESQAFWCDLLHGSRPLFLRKSRKEIWSGHESGADITASRVVILPQTPIPGGVTVSTLVKASWAVVLSFLTGKTDILFYHLVHGRDETWDGASEILGCCIADVPLRVRLADDSITGSNSPAKLLRSIHNQVLSSLPHAHLGAANIAGLMRAEWGEDTVQYSHSSFVQHQNIDSVSHFALGEGAYADVAELGVTDDAIPELSVYSEPWGHGAVEIGVRASDALYESEEVDALVEALAWVVAELAAAKWEEEKDVSEVEDSWFERTIAVMKDMSIQQIK
jgi:non-ribosomal peptide synthetase component F/aryl carrier-like protein